MGKRQIGELQPGELVLAIMLSDLATAPISSVNTPLIIGIFPVVTLMTIEILISYFSQKSVKFRKIVSGSPSIIIENGKINIKELTSLRFSIDDLFEQLRSNGYMTVSDVAFAILETNGQLSVIPSSQATPITLKDLNITSSVTMPRNIIKDGELDENNLRKIGRDKNWLNNLLKSHNTSIEKTFLLTTDGQESFYIQKKEQ
jgi:uncharacterized membrane protein YcaP (DUF421 family)